MPAEPGVYSGLTKKTALCITMSRLVRHKNPAPNDSTYYLVLYYDNSTLPVDVCSDSKTRINHGYFLVGNIHFCGLN